MLASGSSGQETAPVTNSCLPMVKAPRGIRGQRRRRLQGCVLFGSRSGLSSGGRVGGRRTHPTSLTRGEETFARYLYNQVCGTTRTGRQRFRPDQSGSWGVPAEAA